MFYLGKKKKLFGDLVDFAGKVKFAKLQEKIKYEI